MYDNMTSKSRLISKWATYLQYIYTLWLRRCEDAEGTQASRCAGSTLGVAEAVHLNVHGVPDRNPIGRSQGSAVD